MATLLSLSVMLVDGIGQMAIIAVVFGVLQRRRAAPILRAGWLSLLFAAAGLLAMARPVEVVPGAFVDMRGVVVGLAGAFGGWPAALVSAAATAAYRVVLGGHYVGGVLSILLAMTAGLVWRYGLMRNRRVAGNRHLLLLGLMIACQSLLAVVVAPAVSPTMLLIMLTLAIASVLGSLAFGRMIQRELRLIAEERMLADEALQDPLTGLANRRGFERAFLDARALDLDAPLALLLIDVDFFKRVNDTHGHGVGDEVLVAVAARVRASLRAFDQASRHGGEEFAVLLPRSGSGCAWERAETLRRSIAERPIEVASGEPIAVTVSIGVGVCGDGESSLKGLFERADARLYAAKSNGRNRTEIQSAAEPASAASAVAPVSAPPPVPLRSLAASAR
ncbi:GGDEF domain-containing protein [Aureimonas pseudogalii]|uniref:diguanylate cyclase n=1 Tax=Aureimonas pseudogalii TaxID=1744844 RepID=A0A7W6EA18_9HYPH|nr:diguanylate cyclase [Aureimonas pseudogalii]MBB3997510.1 diguanylate cyclase [Aureimonas pseudogalii]